MSCSEFVEHEDEDKSDTLVIIVNGDGTVTVDPHTLERVLNQQCRAAVSFIKWEEPNEPDSQTEKPNVEKNEKQTEDKDSFCHKVNLVVEGYYPPPSLNTSSKSGSSSDSMVSSTVTTPPLPQTTADFLDLLSEGLEIPVSQSNIPTTSNESCIGDSLVDAFSEMAPEQLKQVETALHSEKAKQILGDDVTSVLDTLKIREENDDWVHFDHCYTSVYGNKKTASLSDQFENITVQDSDEATLLTVKVNPNNEVSSLHKSESDTSYAEEIYEKNNDHAFENSSKSNKITTSRSNEAMKLLKKQLSNTLGRAKIVSSDNKITVLKRSLPSNVKSVLETLKDKRSQVHIISKVKKKNMKNEQIEQPPERIVKEDEVDGVKVFKPTRNDKKIIKPFLLNKDNTGNVRNSFMQTKLNFNKHDESKSVGSSKISLVQNKEKSDKNLSQIESVFSKPRSDSISESEEANSKQSGKNKKDNLRKQTSPVTPETFGPALFSTPDIIRKINSDDNLKEGDKLNTDHQSITVDDTSDIEKRMSAIENGEAILDRIHMELERQNKEKEKYASLSDEERLLSDLENSAEESSQDENEKTSSTSTSFRNSKKYDSGDSNSGFSSRKSSNIDNSDKDEVEYEDDPNKLWCICNKPHGNRFMICCDACDNWYHGSCVNVTRPMGEKMELNGTEWLCPSCKKEKSVKEREMKLKLSTRSITNKSVGRQNILNSPNALSADSSQPVPSIPNERSPNQSAAIRRKSSTQSVKSTTVQLCIECKEKETKPDAIYCSNTCITKYVNTFLTSMNSEQEHPLPDEQKIIVHDKKKDHTITGMRAPSVGNLQEWLIEHPSYEIIRPSAFPISRLNSIPRIIKPAIKPVENTKMAFSKMKETQHIVKPKLITKPKDNETSYDDTVQTSIKQFFSSKSLQDDTSQQIKRMEDGSGNIIIREGNVIRTVGLNSKKELDVKTKDKQRQIKLIPVQPLLKSVEEPKVVQTVVKKPVAPTPAVDKDKKRKIELSKKEKPLPKKVELKRQESKKNLAEESTSSEQTQTVQTAIDIRASIRKALNELFVSRLKDVEDINTTEAELTALSIQVEEELFNLFKDIGNKYKIKYRSLNFNIKDPKNTLFRRIAEKSLTPYELVRLTPEELASTELAQWRQREAKHEIDMIKKTELENLNKAKVLVVKTHKGELEIEPEALPPSITDTVVPDLQSVELPEEKDKLKKSSTFVLNKDKENYSSFRKDKESLKDHSDKKDQDKDKDRYKKHDHKDKHKSRKHRHKSSERERHHRSKRSRSQGGEKSSEKDGYKSSTEKSSHRSRSSDKAHSSKSNIENDQHQNHSKRRRSRSRSRSRNRRKNKSDESKEDIQIDGPVITALEKNEGPLNSTEKENFIFDSTADDVKIAADLLSSYNAVDVDLSDMEPTSTVTIKTPPHTQSPEMPICVWKGTLIMPDVAKFHTMLKEVSGNCEGLDEDLQSVIDCVGRINPNTVWDYIAKVKKSDSKEILVLRFEVPEDEQRMNYYFSLYSYLSTKNRMAVVGNAGPSIKDFYVMPLASHSPVPQVLLPLNGPGFEDYRSHILLAVIVRSRRKRFSTNSLLHHSGTSLSKKKTLKSYVSPTSYLAPPSTDIDSFTPPHSPTSLFVNNSTVETSTSKNDDDDDEPYNPEDDEPYSPGALDDEHTNKSSDLQREMEEINRKIEEIESISSSLPQDHNEDRELYSPTENFPVEQKSSNVQLPEDLQQLINSFSKRSSEVTSNISIQADPIVDAYKNNADASRDHDEEDENLSSNPTFSPSEIVEELRNSPVTPAQEIIDESKVNRDPRRKPVVSECFRSTVSQPPPPGMEDEFMSPSSFTPIPTTTESSLAVANPVPDPTYTVPLQAAPYAFSGAPTVPPFPPPMIPQIYMTAPPVYPQPGAMSYAPIPPPQMFVPPPVLHHDPSMIPLPIDSADTKNSLKRKATDEIDKEIEKDKSCGTLRKNDSKGKKSQSYYSDSKSKRSNSKSPPRHKSLTGYDSHHRGYQRDDVEYGSGSSRSRYGHKYGRNYSNRRSNYWKGGSGDHSSNHRKYSDSRSRRSNSREKNSRRYDSSKNMKEEWDTEIRHFETQQREKPDYKKSDTSSKRS